MYQKKNDQIHWINEVRSLDELVFNDINPRKISKKQQSELKKSIENLGFIEPITITSSNVVLGGHQRLRTLMELGFTHVEVRVPDRELTHEEEKETIIRLNRNRGSWDDELLANFWDPEELVNYGFSQEELHLESIPNQKEAHTRFGINIKCIDQEQLELVEKHIESILCDFSGASYKVRIS